MTLTCLVPLLREPDTIGLSSQCAGLQAHDVVVFPGDLGVRFTHEKVILDTQD
jgi:hypothetical protein